MNKNQLIIFFLLSLATPVWASYTIKGKVNMKGAWQQQIYLSTIDRLDDYYSGNAEFIINIAPIDMNGEFVITGDNLPEYAQFYKLYLSKEAHSEFNACFYVSGEEHNFIHLLLDNESQLEITADTTVYAPFGDYQIKGDLENQYLKNLGTLIFPSYRFYEIRFPSELKYSEDKLNRDLFHFADTCSSLLVALAAINNTDFQAYFDTKYEQYQGFGERFLESYPQHPYSKNYLRKLRYYDEDILPKPSYLFPFLTGLFVLLSGLLWYQNNRLRKDLAQALAPKVEKEKAIPFTPQELKILQLIQTGKSNKEIASELFIEVSTVKSHINKLYAKLQVKNRREAIEKAGGLIL